MVYPSSQGFREVFIKHQTIFKAHCATLNTKLKRKTVLCLVNFHYHHVQLRVNGANLKWPLNKMIT